MSNNFVARLMVEKTNKCYIHNMVIKILN